MPQDSGRAVVGGLRAPILAGIAAGAAVLIIVVVVIAVRLGGPQEASESSFEVEQADVFDPRVSFSPDGVGLFLTEASPLFTQATIETGFEDNE
jgi:hypothetical protein